MYFRGLQSFAIYLLIFAVTDGQDTRLLKIRLPKELHDWRNVDSETTLCTSVDIAETIYIKKLTPALTKDTNHIILAGIGLSNTFKFDPKSNESLSKCSNLVANASDLWQSGSGLNDQVVATLFVAGNKGGQSVTLPPNVAFEVGGEAPIKRLILQVHLQPLKNWKAKPDSYAGVDVYFTTERQPLKAGILSLHAGGQILPGARSFLEASCALEQDIWALSYLGHAHDLGKTISLWHINKSQTQWSLLGEINPQLPQQFRPVQSVMRCSQGDVLAVRCGYYNDTPNLVQTGATRKDEMCAMYLLYYSTDNVSAKPYCMGGQTLVPL